MGSIYVTNPDEPVSALAYVGCFGFVAGEPNRELLENKPEGFAIITPQNEAWAALIEEVYPSVRKVTRDFVSSFTDKKQYLGLGRGIVILKDDKIVSGASSYTRYNEGIEIEVDTVESERRNHLATVACSALILRCLSENLYPSWDAQNMNSVHLAEKLGYEFDHEYVAYEVDRTRRVH
nr:GNAT family N-acetyltransferase [uncultured Butyrivibrio sp.]